MKKKTSILVICHDAGGSEIISAYVNKNKDKFNFICLVAGPAIKIFKSKKIKFSAIFLKQKPAEYFFGKKINMVMTGMSWATAIGFDFIRFAKKNNIKTVVYLDHWVDYRKGFGYPSKGWVKNMPDEIWAGDKYAFKSAKKFFPKASVKLVPNLYFKEIEQRYRVIKKNIHSVKKTILFMSEPIGTPASCFHKKSLYKFNEYYVLEIILKYLSGKKIKNDVVICFHPSENKSKYDYLIAEYLNKLSIKKQESEVLAEIARASIVIGMMSMILAVAAICRKKVISFIPDKKVKCPLPLDNIIKINRIEELSKHIGI